MSLTLKGLGTDLSAIEIHDLCQSVAVLLGLLINCSAHIGAFVLMFLCGSQLMLYILAQGHAQRFFVWYQAGLDAILAVWQWSFLSM